MPLTLLLLPGMDGTGDLFDDFTAALGAAVPVQIVRYPTDVSLGYPELLAYVVARLPKEPFAVLGESFSGPLALQLAAQRPANLAAVVLCCSFARSPAPLPKACAPWVARLPVAALARWLAAPLLLGLSAPPASRKALQAAIGRVRPRVLQDRAAAVAEVDATATLHHIQIPVLDLRAAQDRLVPAQARRPLQNGIPHLRTTTLTGPHGLLQVQPKAAAHAVLGFLQAAATEPAGQHPAD